MKKKVKVTIRKLDKITREEIVNAEVEYFDYLDTNIVKTLNFLEPINVCNEENLSWEILDDLS